MFLTITEILNWLHLVSKVPLGSNNHTENVFTLSSEQRAHIDSNNHTDKKLTSPSEQRPHIGCNKHTKMNIYVQCLPTPPAQFLSEYFIIEK